MCTKNRDQHIFRLTNLCCIHFRCGFPCSHILRVTNDIQLDMIKIQHWKIYAAHYNDESSGIGMELKKIQLAYRHYEGLGVPISGEWLTRSRKCNLDRVFPYLYDGTSNDDDKLALEVDRSNCSVTVSEFFSTKQNTKHGIRELLHMQQYCGWCGSGSIFNSTKHQTNVFFATGFVRRERGSNKIVYMWVFFKWWANRYYAYTTTIKIDFFT